MLLRRPRLAFVPPVVNIAISQIPKTRRDLVVFRPQKNDQKARKDNALSGLDAENESPGYLTIVRIAFPLLTTPE
jgi:hypothetical protein